jgi:hypothetical protein
MAESDFMDAFAQKLRERGFDPSYTGYGGGLDKSIQGLTEAQGKIKGKPRIDTEALKKKTGRGWLASLTPEERQTIAAYGEYDAARKNLASRAAETLNTPKGATMSRQEATQSAVDELARAQREQQYAAPATSTPESPVPTAAPAMPAPAPATPASPEFDGEALSRALIEAPSVPAPEIAPREMPASPAAAPEISEDRMSALFRKTMGTAFDPKSKMDAGKMQQLRDFVSNNPDALNKSDTKIALDYYRTLK